MKILTGVLDSPWKAVNEAVMYLLKIPAVIYMSMTGIEIGSGFKFYGLPRFFRFRGSKISIGDRFESRNFWDSNPLGINHPTIICTWGKNAVIKIGRDVGISGGSIVAADKIEIGDGTLIGANTTIIDTDFHPIHSGKRRYATKNVKSKPIKIGRNVFIGMNSVVLKGVQIPDNSIVPAGSVVRRWEK
jgi:acetyltransferase-like isoleucine patch superfamily enzyme